MRDLAERNLRTSWRHDQYPTKRIQVISIVRQIANVDRVTLASFDVLAIFSPPMPERFAERLRPSQVSNLRFCLPSRIGRRSLDCREQVARKRRRRMRHIRPFSSRAQGRFRFDGNRGVLTKRDDWVASSPERQRCSASAKSRRSPRLRAYSRLNRNVACLELESSIDPARRAFGSSSTDLPERCSNNSGRSTPSWGTPSQKEHSS